MSKTVLKTKIFGIQKFKSERNGGRGPYFYRMVTSNSVVILPLLDDGTVVLERQYRPAINKYIYEIPAGLIEKGESPAHAAVRELEEETGYLAGSMQLLFAGYPSPGTKTEFSTCYLATKLAKTKTNMDPDEVIDVKKVRLEELVRMIKRNQIVDVKTIAAVLFYVKFSA